MVQCQLSGVGGCVRGPLFQGFGEAAMVTKRVHIHSYYGIRVPKPL